LGGAEKKIAGSGRARRVPEGGLEDAGSRENRRRAPGVRGRDGHQRFALPALRLVSQGCEGLRQRSAQLGQERDPALASITAEGLGPCLAVEGATTRREVFEAYLERVLAPTLRSGQIVVMDNLLRRTREAGSQGDPRGAGLRAHIPAALLAGARPHRRSVLEAQGATLRRAESRTREGLIEAMGRALTAVTHQDARGFFGHCGYRSMDQLL
jgi:hypothetical protein